MGQSQPKTTVVKAPNPYLIQQITRPEDFRALADQINKYREQTFSQMGDIERMTGTTADIGARTSKIFENAAAAYKSSLPQADRYIRATTGVNDPYAAARESALSNLDFSKRLSEEAVKESESYQAPAYSPEHFSWEDIPPPGQSTPKEDTPQPPKKNRRKAGQVLSNLGGLD